MEKEVLVITARLVMFGFALFVVATVFGYYLGTLIFR